MLSLSNPAEFVHREHTCQVVKQRGFECLALPLLRALDHFSSQNLNRASQISDKHILLKIFESLFLRELFEQLLPLVCPVALQGLPRLRKHVLVQPVTYLMRKRKIQVKTRPTLRAINK